MITAFPMSIFAIIRILTIFVIVLLPFYRIPGFDRKDTLFKTGFLLLFCFIVGNLVGQNLNEYDDFRSMYMVLGYGSAALLLYLCVPDKPAKLLFVFFLALRYIDDVSAYIWLVSKYLFGLNLIADYYETLILSSLIVIVLTLPLMLLFMKKLVEPLVLNQHEEGFWVHLWLIPFIFYTLYAFALDLHDIRYSRELTPTLYFTIQFVWTSSSFFTIGVFLKMLSEGISTRTIEGKLQTTQLYLNMQRKEYERLRNVIDNTRKARHDLRQQLTVLKGLAEQRDTEAIASYVDNYLSHSDIERSTTICDNYAVNALVQYYAAQATEEGTPMTCKLSLPPRMPIPEADVCAILGNMIENALTACKQQPAGENKFIDVKGNCLHDMLVFTVRNSFHGQIERKGEAFISSKREHHREGVGITSIKQTAERYHGTTSFRYDQGIFEASVLLNKL